MGSSVGQRGNDTNAVAGGIEETSRQTVVHSCRSLNVFIIFREGKGRGLWSHDGVLGTVCVCVCGGVCVLLQHISDMKIQHII